MNVFNEIQMNTKIGDSLKQLRLDMGVTQEYVEKKTMIPASKLSLYEKGVKFPELRTICKLATLYKCSIDSIVFNNGYHQCAYWPSDEFGQTLNALEVLVQNRIIVLTDEGITFNSLQYGLLIDYMKKFRQLYNEEDELLFDKVIRLRKETGLKKTKLDNEDRREVEEVIENNPSYNFHIPDKDVKYCFTIISE